MKERIRAARNRTLTVDAEEYDCLKKRLVMADGKKINAAAIMNRTICGDLMEIADLLPEKIADLIVIDPPYNLNKDFGNVRFKALSVEAYLDYVRGWFPKVLRLLKDDGSLYMCGDWRCTSALQQVLQENMHVLNRITWQREKGRGASSNWKNGMEDIWFAVMDKNRYYFDLEAVKVKRRVMAPYKENGVPKDWEESDKGKFRITCPSNFWDDISVPYWSMPENTYHPTQKPEKLLAKLILASCPEGGVVFDPFLGSGTTSVVAKKLGRKYIGVEINEEYAVWAEKRLELAEANDSIQGYADGVFWERNSFNAQRKAGIAGITNRHRE